MKKDSVFLFDLDGVIIDTEPQYDCLWRKIAADYQLGIEHFEHLIKGTTVPNILAKYFSHLSLEEHQKIEKTVISFELQMDIVPIPGILIFLNELKTVNAKIGLVTSSPDEKIDYVFQKLPIKHYFDTIVSADIITKGKPEPMCYLLAAQDLNVFPEECIVFEDSFNGIKSGNAAGMKVIGLSTTNLAESIEKDCVMVIPDFRNLAVASLQNL
jgi:HAD superfamily hydrolase (TIGR01509 family)